MEHNINNIEYVTSADGREYVLVNGQDIVDDFDFEYNLSKNVTILHFAYDGRWFSYMMPVDTYYRNMAVTGAIPTVEIDNMLEGM